jgi:Spy/CpxP family protein refolding chaperone
MMALARHKLWFVVFVLVIIAIGFGGGVAADRYLMFGRRPFLGRPGPPKPSQIADRMSQELGLSAEQRTQLEAVFERNGDRLEAFRAQTRAQFEAIRKQLDSEISAILTPDQRARFDAQRKRRERNRPMREGEPRGFPPPR